MKSKITPAQKEMIRINYSSGRMNMTEMARHLNTSTRTIGRIIEEHGLALPLAKRNGDSHQAMEVLKEWNLEPQGLHKMLQLMKNLGYIETKDGATQVNLYPYISDSQIVHKCSKMEELAWGELLNKIVTSRVAQASNTHVQTAMLNLQQKVENNAKESEELRNK